MRLKLAPQIRLWWTGGFGPLIFRSSIVITEGLSAIATTQTNLPYRILTKKANIRRIGSLVNQLMSRRGYAQAFANEEIHRVIAATVGTPLDSGFAVGKLQAGVLQVYASDSVTLQELNFQKRKILRNIQQNMPGNQIIDLRFRIQT